VSSEGRIGDSGPSKCGFSNWGRRRVRVSEYEQSK